MKRGRLAALGTPSATFQGRRKCYRGLNHAGAGGKMGQAEIPFGHFLFFQIRAIDISYIFLATRKPTPAPRKSGSAAPRLAERVTFGP